MGWWCANIKNLQPAWINIQEKLVKIKTAMRKGTRAIFLVFKINMKRCISWPPKWLRESWDTSPWEIHKYIEVPQWQFPSSLKLRGSWLQQNHYRSRIQWSVKKKKGCKIRNWRINIMAKELNNIACYIIMLQDENTVLTYRTCKPCW